MYRIPPFIRRFRRSLLLADLLAGRRIFITSTDDEGNRHTSIQVVDKPISPFAPGGPYADPSDPPNSPA